MIILYPHMHDWIGYIMRVSIGSILSIDFSCIVENPTNIERKQRGLWSLNHGLLNCGPIQIYLYVISTTNF
jgi:hypothetical protein